MLLDCCLYPRPKSDLWTLKTHHWQTVKTMGAESRWSLLHLCYEKQNSKSVTVLPTSSVSILLLLSLRGANHSEPNASVLSFTQATREEFLKRLETYIPVLFYCIVSLRQEIRSPSNMENGPIARFTNGPQGIFQKSCEHIENCLPCPLLERILKEPND